MKKASTYVWLTVAVVNSGVGALIMQACAIMTRAYADILGGADTSCLHWLTTAVLTVSWWPYAVAILSVIGAIFSVVMPLKREILSHVLTAVLLAEVAGLGLTAFGLCLPLWIPGELTIP